MILVITASDEAGYGESIRKTLPDMPLVFTTDAQQIKNWLPIVDAVFIHQKTAGWVSGSNFPLHHQMLMVVPVTPTAPNVNDMFKNMRECCIDLNNVYMLADPEDVERLKMRFASSTIQEKP